MDEWTDSLSDLTAQQRFCMEFLQKRSQRAIWTPIRRAFYNLSITPVSAGKACPGARNWTRSFFSPLCPLSLRTTRISLLSPRPLLWRNLARGRRAGHGKRRFGGKPLVPLPRLLPGSGRPHRLSSHGIPAQAAAAAERSRPFWSPHCGAGLPARQVYAPAGAHCATTTPGRRFGGGEMALPGAAEPEPVLDRGWFNTQPAGRFSSTPRTFGRGKAPHGSRWAWKTAARYNVDGAVRQDGGAGLTVTRGAGARRRGRKSASMYSMSRRFIPSLCLTAGERRPRRRRLGLGDVGSGGS